MENSSILLLTAFLVTFSHFAFFSASEQPAYVPTENITLNCGAPTGDYDQDGRFWTGENGSKFGPFENISSARYDADKQNGPRVPYMTARVSTSKFKYSFPVTPGQKFVRLYFNPASYGRFDRSKAFFDVKAGSFTLLHNFSAYLVAANQSSPNVYREFSFNVQENQHFLDLIFTPTASNDTYAFVNGIELVSMPTNLYYTPSEFLQGVTLVGQDFGYHVDNYTALEMVYRFNVGGNTINPTDDTGMFRLWSDDSPYVRTDSYVTLNKSSPLHYTIKPKYSAPDEVYETARTLGPNRTFNLNHNLTWRLPVDLGFLYLARLHFCEPHDVINSQGLRVFNIFLNGQLAESRFDIIAWTDSSRVPYYQDYVVSLLNKGKQSKQSIILELQAVDVKYLDVILNGIEVFKLNNSEGSLAGPNPELSVVTPPPSGPNDSTRGKSKATRMVIAGIGCAVVLLILLSLVMFWRNRKRQQHGSYVNFDV